MLIRKPNKEEERRAEAVKLLVKENKIRMKKQEGAQLKQSPQSPVAEKKNDDAQPTKHGRKSKAGFIPQKR